MIAEEDLCTEMVGEPPGYWHEHRCTRAAKWLVRDLKTDLPRGVCSQHRKWHDRWGSVLGAVTGGDAGAPDATSAEVGRA